MSPRRRKPAPVKVIHADGSTEIRAQRDFPRASFKGSRDRRGRPLRGATRNQRKLAASIARDLAEQRARQEGSP
jgi:hypothetical protein